MDKQLDATITAY